MERIRHFDFLFTVIIILFCTIELRAQSTVEGTVTDENTLETLPGVNILVKGTTTGTSTDAEGNFELTVKSLQDTLVVSYIGYQTKEVAINGRTTIDVALQPQTISGEELVVVGYGTQEKETLTAAVSEVEGEKISRSPISNITESLAGNIAGVSMRSTSAQPGEANPDINIRGVSTIGNSSPLIVIDGIERNNISQIDPNTIESVTVLKDAAAVAPYGVGGANGVILITTKEGSKETPITVDINAYYGIQTPTYYPDLVKAKDFMRLKTEAYINENPNATTPPYTKEYIANYDNLNKKDPDKYPITNEVGKKYQDLSVPMQNYDVQLSGGSERITYYTQLGFLEKKGMFPGSNYRRYNYTLKSTVQATKTTEISASVIGSIDRVNDIDGDISTEQLFRGQYKYSPLDNLYYSNGKWGASQSKSPIGILNAGGYSHNNQTTLLTKLHVKQEIAFVDGLSVEGSFSYDLTNGNIKDWHRPFQYWTQDTSTEPYTYSKSISTETGQTYTWLSEESLKNEHFTFQGYINYKGNFGKHDISGLFVAEGRYNTSKSFMARRNHFAVNIDELNLGSSKKENFVTGGFSSTGSQVGFVFRTGYQYDDKYLLQFSGRYDGHYYFSPGNRWGFFPAFSLGWVLSEENFFKEHLNFIDYFKIRGSWGESGNLAGSAFQYLAGYNLYGQAYAFSGGLVQGSYIDQEPNPFITWEVSTKTDIGFDATMWEGLLDISFDYFYQRRTDMLLPPAVTVPFEYGLELSDENAGIMNTRGVEVAINSSIINGTGNSFQLDLAGTFSYAQNSVEEIFETAATFNNPRRRRTGRALNVPFGYKSLGLFQTSDDKNGDGIINGKDGYDVEQFGELHPGDIKYADFNGDGRITAEDKTVIGYPNYPAITFGFTPSINWNNFDLSLFFQGSAMSSIDIRGFKTIPFYNNNSNTTYEYYNNRWTSENQNARYPRATLSPYSNNTVNSDFWMVNTSYVRLKTATLGYTLPKQLSQVVNIQSLRLYFTGRNLFTFSNIKFQDPEVNYNQTDGTAYPTQKIYTLGLNISF